MFEGLFIVSYVSMEDIIKCDKLDLVTCVHVFAELCNANILQSIFTHFPDPFEMNNGGLYLLNECVVDHNSAFVRLC